MPRNIVARSLASHNRTCPRAVVSKNYEELKAEYQDDFVAMYGNNVEAHGPCRESVEEEFRKKHPHLSFVNNQALLGTLEEIRDDKAEDLREYNPDKDDPRFSTFWHGEVDLKQHYS